MEQETKKQAADRRAEELRIQREEQGMKMPISPERRKVVLGIKAELIRRAAQIDTVLDPEELSLAIQLVGKYVELGVSKLKDILREVFDKYGEQNYRRLFRSIKAGYKGYKTDAAEEIDALMDDFGDVKKLDVDNLLNEFKAEDKNVSGTTRDLESDSSRNELKDKVGGEDVQSNGGREKQGTGKGSTGDEGKRDGELSDNSISARDAADDGEPSDI